MKEEVVAATNALEGFATYMESFWTDQPYHIAHGQSWNMPPLSRSDLANRSRRLSQRLKLLSDDQVKEELQRQIGSLPAQISFFQTYTLPQIQNGNAPQVLANFDMIMSNIEQSFPLQKPTPNWEEIESSNLVPSKLSKRIRNLEAALSRIEPRAGDLEGKIKAIEEAHAAATDLPTDLEALKEAREEISDHQSLAAKAAAAAEASKEVILKAEKDTLNHANAAEQLIAKIDQAYSAATTAGLAGAFKRRAEQLGFSTWVWVAFLASALTAGGIMGHIRLQSFQELVSKGADAQWIWLEAVMSVLSIAAPVWFAWLSTRQIGQRFKLAEDYGFKAAVAQAYEGYRKEAVRLDPQLEARLFASALDRLEEPPSRFLPQVDHNSPYEALIESTGFQRALGKIPSLRETMQAVLDKVPITSENDSNSANRLSRITKAQEE